MEQQVLEYTRRTPKGTCAVRRLRREGRLPGVLYGHKQDAVPLSVDQESFDLSVKNPNAPEEDPLRSPEEILAEIEALDAEAAEVLAGIRGML